MGKNRSEAAHFLGYIWCFFKHIIDISNINNKDQYTFIDFGCGTGTMIKYIYKLFTA